jgi:hypothetical protein
MRKWLGLGSLAIMKESVPYQKPGRNYLGTILPFCLFCCWGHSGQGAILESKWGPLRHWTCLFFYPVFPSLCGKCKKYAFDFYKLFIVGSFTIAAETIRNRNWHWEVRCYYNKTNVCVCDFGTGIMGSRLNSFEQNTRKHLFLIWILLRMIEMITQKKRAAKRHRDSLLQII